MRLAERGPDPSYRSGGRHAQVGDLQVLWSENIRPNKSACTRTDCSHQMKQQLDVGLEDVWF